MATRRRTLIDAVLPHSYLRAAVVKGSSAIRKDHRALIATKELARIWDSLNFDSATQGLYPEENRWDYFVSVSGCELIVGIEPHSASDSEVSVIIRKKNHAAAVLQDQLAPGARVSRWYWVASTKIRFGRMERSTRQLNRAGITFVGNRIASFG